MFYKELQGDSGKIGVTNFSTAADQFPDKLHISALSAADPEFIQTGYKKTVPFSGEIGVLFQEPDHEQQDSPKKNRRCTAFFIRNRRKIMTIIKICIKISCICRM